VAWAILLGVLGALLTRLDAWYYTLRFPEWKPPDWAFGPIWTAIFVLAAIAFVLAWNAPDADSRRRVMLIAAYVANGMLNMFWSFLFFLRHRPDWAFTETALLWLSIGMMIAVVAPLSSLGAALLLPYLLWVSLAWALTRAVVRLNGPFAA
jgi:tryptophan-rich sensory protein